MTSNDDNDNPGDRQPGNPEPASDALGPPPRDDWRLYLDKAHSYAAQQFQREIPAARRLLTAARKAIKLAEASDEHDPHGRRHVLRQKAVAVGFKVMGGGLEWEAGFNGLREVALKWPDRDPKEESDAKIGIMIGFGFLEAFRATTDPKRKQSRPATADLDDFVAYLPDHTFICRKTRASGRWRGSTPPFRMPSYRPASRSNAANRYIVCPGCPGRGKSSGTRWS
jgi:hypothetical protein